MRKLLIFLLIAIMAVISACSQESPAEKPHHMPDHFVLVEGGTFMNKKSNYYGEKVALSDFYIGKYEVTQKEWMEVMGSNPSEFKGDNLPVETVSWYDVVEYCNSRSIKEGLTPYYHIDKTKKDPKNKSETDHLKWTVTINEGANGYRLENNHNQTKSTGVKKPNELGLYDMSGNVREWCWNGYGDSDSSSSSTRVVKGGGWMGDVGELSYLSNFEANGIGPDQGFRICRDG